MITTFCGKDINSVYLDALSFAADSSHSITNSRDGDVYDLGQVYFEFSEPINQLLLMRGRKFNPYFALLEAAWVLSGSDKLEPLEKIISEYNKFSDDGVVLNGAYGHRIRHAFKVDQLEKIIELLINKPDTRRAVITLYSPTDILNENSVDIPCNTTLYFKIKNGKLDITVINRSNDIFLGIPYNVFVFNVILQYVAHRINIGIGVQRHFTDCLHLYKKNLNDANKIIASNSMSEIKSWQCKTNNSESLLKGIIKYYNEIVTFDIENIVNPYIKGILESYLNYKKRNDAKFLISTLSKDDIFGISAYLWISSLSSYENNDDIFLDKV